MVAPGPMEENKMKLAYLYGEPDVVESDEPVRPERSGRIAVLSEAEFLRIVERRGQPQNRRRTNAS